jgi:hypothetical protein
MLDCSMGKRLWHLQRLFFLRGTFGVDDLIGVTKNKETYLAPNDCSLKVARTIILDFLSRNWYDSFGISSNSVRNLLLRISIKNNIVSWTSGRIQAIFECQSQRISWIVQYSHQSIAQNWNIIFQFGRITNMGNLLTSEPDFLTNLILSGKFANWSWDKTFGEVCKKDFNWSDWLYRHSLRRYCRVS